MGRSVVVAVSGASVAAPPSELSHAANLQTVTLRAPSAALLDSVLAGPSRPSQRLYADGVGVVDESFRKSREYAIPTSMQPFVLDVYEHVRKYADRWALRPSEPLAYNAAVLLYTPGCFLHEHDDYTHATQRRFTSVLFLNDSYEGGEICFPKQGLVLKPKAGTLLLFPARSDHPHSVKEVLSGRRAVMQSFWGLQ